MIAMLLCSCGTHQSTNDILKYDEYIVEIPYAKDHMPSVDDLGDFKYMTIHNKKNIGLISSTNSVSLFIKYDREAYESMCKVIDNQYEYLKESTEYITDIVAKVNNYEIKIVKKEEIFDFEDSFYDYPKAFLMIGFNEQDNSVAYFYHYDIDIDYIDNLDNYIKKEYSWD